MIYEISVCSKTVSLLPVKNSFINEHIVSSSWTVDGNLLICDNFENVWMMYNDGKRRHMLVKSDNKHHDSLKQKPIVVAFRGGVALVNSRSQIMVIIFKN